jgi:phage/plasmid-like protein (TIGR03299 family)
MAAEIETMMYAGETPWHGLGTRVPQDLPAGEAIVAAGLNWKVEKKPVYHQVEADDGNGGIAKIQKVIPGVNALVRDTDKQVMSVMSKEYQPFQNEEMFAFGEALVGTKRARFHTAGSLNGGRRVWALIKTDNLIEVTSKDVVEAYLLLANSFDGSLSYRAAFTGTRVVCQNTLNAALAGVKQGVSVRHTGKLADRIAEAQQVLGLADGYFAKFQEVAKALVATPYSDAQMKTLATDLFAPAKVDAEGNIKVSDAGRENAGKVIELFTTGKGHDLIAGTAWAAYNAVAEFTDHHARTRTTDRATAQENRMNSIYFGTANTLKQAALARIGKDVGMRIAA